MMQVAPADNACEIVVVARSTDGGANSERRRLRGAGLINLEIWAFQTVADGLRRRGAEGAIAHRRLNSPRDRAPPVISASS